MPSHAIPSHPVPSRSIPSRPTPSPQVLFESVTWEIVGIGEEFGFTESPGGEHWRNKSVLAFHNSVQEQASHFHLAT